MRALALLALLLGIGIQLLLDGQTYSHAIVGIVCGIVAIICSTVTVLLAAGDAGESDRFWGVAMAVVGLILTVVCIIALPHARETQKKFNERRMERLAPKVQSRLRMKHFKLSKEEIRPLAEGYGACIATDKITVEGLPVRFLYRAAPDNDVDSGWRFMSGFESDDYMDDPSHHSVYDVNTIANYDPSVIPLLNSPEGSVFEKPDGASDFIPVTDWQIPQ